MLIQHTCTHALQHRQRVRQGHFSHAEYLEPQHALRAVERAVQAHRHGCGIGQTCKHLDIVRSHGAREIFLVGCRKTVDKPIGQSKTMAFAVNLKQRLLAIVFPAPGESGNARLQRWYVDVFGGLLTSTHQVMDASQRAIRQLRSEFD